MCKRKSMMQSESLGSTYEGDNCDDSDMKSGRC